MARAFDWQSRGRRFDSVCLHEVGEVGVSVRCECGCGVQWIKYKTSSSEEGLVFWFLPVFCQRKTCFWGPIRTSGLPNKNLVCSIGFLIFWGMKFLNYLNQIQNIMKASLKIMQWLPRIICILAILFTSFFAVDAFAPGLTIWQQLGGFIMNLIPSFILIALLIIAWKWEYIGGIIFTILGLGLCPLIFMLNHNRNKLSIGQSLGNVLMIAVPFLIVGILFIISHFMKKKNLR